MIFTMGNFKGGVGKTITSTMFAYILTEHLGKKVLAVDTDQQGDFTDELEVTFKNKIDRTKNVYSACLGDEDVTESIQSLSENLDLLCGSQELKDFSIDIKAKWNKKTEEALQDKILSMALEEVKDDYDFILIDTNPAIDLLTMNVLTATDYVLIPTKTNARDKEKTMRFFNFLADNHVERDFSLIGIIAYLVEDSATDRKVLLDYKELFSDYLLENLIKNSAVVKRWSYEGITENRAYDKQTLSMYRKVVDEILIRVEREEEIK